MKRIDVRNNMLCLLKCLHNKIIEMYGLKDMKTLSLVMCVSLQAFFYRDDFDIVLNNNRLAQIPYHQV